MQAIAPAALFIQGDTLAFDAIEAGSQGLLELLPDDHFGLVSAFAHLGRRVAAQVDQRGHGQLLHFAFQLEFSSLLGGEHTL